MELLAVACSGWQTGLYDPTVQTAVKMDNSVPGVFTLDGSRCYVVPPLTEKSSGSGGDAACVTGPAGLGAHGLGPAARTGPAAQPAAS